jgi:hypothetical protein
MQVHQPPLLQPCLLTIVSHNRAAVLWPAWWLFFQRASGLHWLQKPQTPSLQSWPGRTLPSLLIALQSASGDALLFAESPSLSQQTLTTLAP